MDVILGKFNYFVVLVFFTTKIDAVPPDACFANFRWDDCGQPPQPMMYYWKPGSRCEVGIWRGCLPNPNMFHDEYECINTCIFVARAQPEDYHDHFSEPDYPDDITMETPTDYDAGNGTLDGNSTMASNVTDSDVSGAGGNTTEEVTGGGGNGTEAGGDATGDATEEPATEAPPDA